MSGHFSSRKRVTPINAACAGRSVEFWDIRHIQKRCRHQWPVCLPLQLLYASTIDIVWTNDRISRDWRLHRDYRSTTDFKKYTFFFYSLTYKKNYRITAVASCWNSQKNGIKILKIWCCIRDCLIVYLEAVRETNLFGLVILQ